MSQYFQPAPLRDRVLAAAIDFGGALSLWILLHVLGLGALGAIVATLYLLFRDGSEGQSIGKRLFSLTTVDLRRMVPTTWLESFNRNLFVSVPFLGLLFSVVEASVALRNSDLRRFGDRFAHTMVVPTRSLLEDDDRVDDTNS